MIRWLYERLTGWAWTTSRSMAAEFGPTLATRFPELAQFSDADLIAMDRADIIAKIVSARASAGEDGSQ